MERQFQLDSRSITFIPNQIATDLRGDLKKLKVRLIVRDNLQDPRTFNEAYAENNQRKSTMLLPGVAKISTADISFYIVI